MVGWVIGSYDGGIEIQHEATKPPFGSLKLKEPTMRVYLPWHGVASVTDNPETIQAYLAAVAKRDESKNSGEQTLDTQVKNV